MHGYDARRRLPVVQVRILAACLLCVAGCFDWSTLAKPEPDGAAQTGGDAGLDVGEDTGGGTAPLENVDPFAAAAAELEPGQKPYLDAARPFIEAVVQRDYAAAFTHLGPTAKQRFSRNQFIPADDEQEYARQDAEPIVNPTAEQFVQLMQEVEATYGMPRRCDPPSVETDPEILSRQDPVLAAFEIGALPDSIPVEQRKAAVQTWVYFSLSDDQIKQAAQQEGIDEAEYRQMLAESESGGEGPYFKLKTVVIDAGAGPVVGYFEIAPPSILD